MSLTPIVPKDIYQQLPWEVREYRDFHRGLLIYKLHQPVSPVEGKVKHKDFICADGRNVEAKTEQKDTTNICIELVSNLTPAQLDLLDTKSQDGLRRIVSEAKHRGFDLGLGMADLTTPTLLSFVRRWDDEDATHYLWAQDQLKAKLQLLVSTKQLRLAKTKPLDEDKTSNQTSNIVALIPRDKLDLLGPPLSVSDVTQTMKAADIDLIIAAAQLPGVRAALLKRLGVFA